MENASKALLIAGAILIAILIISLGIILINSGNGANQQAQQVGDVISIAAGDAVNKIAISGENVENNQNIYNISVNCIRVQCG